MEMGNKAGGLSFSYSVEASVRFGNYNVRTGRVPIKVPALGTPDVGYKDSHDNCDFIVSDSPWHIVPPSEESSAYVRGGGSLSGLNKQHRHSSYYMLL